MTDHPYLYFAYGSNLNRPQMKLRCPKSEAVRRLAVKDWRLTFRGVADVERHKGGELHGALYRITKRCEEALDRYEGYRPDGTGLYDKVIFRLATGEAVMMYKMTRRDKAPPPKPYLWIIREGYRHWKLKMSALDDAVDRAVSLELATRKQEEWGDLLAEAQ